MNDTAKIIFKIFLMFMAVLMLAAGCTAYLVHLKI